MNLEEPHVFGEQTISTRDDILDIWIPAATHEPAWKDEDEIAMAVKVGRLSTGREEKLDPAAGGS